MWELILPIIDRLWNLLKLQKEQDEALFRNHLEPIFLDIAMVHDNYCNGFQEILDLLKRDPPDQKAVMKLMRRRVRELKSTRDKLKALLTEYFSLEDIPELHFRQNGEQWKKDSPREYFLCICMNYFLLACGINKSSFFTAVESIICEWSNRQLSLDNCLEQTINVLRVLNEHWILVTKAYANARWQLLPK